MEAKGPARRPTEEGRRKVGVSWIDGKVVDRHGEEEIRGGGFGQMIWLR